MSVSSIQGRIALKCNGCGDYLLIDCPALYAGDPSDWREAAAPLGWVYDEDTNTDRCWDCIRILN